MESVTIIVFMLVVIGYSIAAIMQLNMIHTEIVSLRDKYEMLSKLGSQYDLSFSSHLVLGNQIVALDGIKRALLIADIQAQDPPCIIELARVVSISVKRSYGSIRAGELTTKGFEEFLQTIELQFQYGSDKSIALPFYNYEKNDVRDLPRLDRNARNWQMILSKMIARPVLPAEAN